MLCGNCQSGYDNTEHVPRILISCGHTFCESCIQAVIQEEKLAKEKSNSGDKAGDGSSATQSESITFDCFECGIPC